MVPFRTSLSVLLCSLGIASSPGALAQAPAMLFEGDMVIGGKPASGGPSCVLTSQFRRGDIVVWRIRVLDPATGQSLGEKQLKSVRVELPDGRTFAARFGPHPKGKPTDEFWAASWEIPADYPTGTLFYTVTAVDQQGRTAKWQPFKVAPSQLTIVP